MTHTPLLKIQSVSGFADLYVKDESVWPNGTFKDRLSSQAVARSGANATTFATLSYGNTALSIARYARDATLPNGHHQTLVIVPEDFQEWEFGPSTLGTVLSAADLLNELRRIAVVVPMNLSTEVLDDGALLRIARDAGLPCSRFVNVTEGLDAPAYVGVIEEAVEQLGRPPDVCIVPYGAGILCNEIRDYLARLGHGRVVPLSVSSRESLARMLYGPIWLDIVALETRGVAMSRHNSPDRTGAVRQPYPVWRVSESEIADGLAIAALEGLSAEPSGAAGLGVLSRLDQILPDICMEESLVLVINTGNGIDALRHRCR